MSKKSVDDVLNEGIYGTKQIKPAELNRFLGTYRERVVLALTKGQLMQDKALAELEAAMRNHSETKLLLNGHVSIRFMKEELNLASKYSIPYTVVTNQDFDSDLAAVLTYDHAVDIENIYVEEKIKEEKKESKSLLSKIKNWF